MTTSLKALLAFLVALSFGSTTFAQEIDIRALVGKDWYGLYMNGQKVGYSLQETAVSDDGAVTLIEDARFKLNMVGIKQDMRIYSKRAYRADGTLASIESSIDDISGSTKLRAAVQGDSLILRSTVGGQDNREVFPAPAESVADMTAQFRLISNNPTVGRSLEFSLFEPVFKREIGGVSELIAIEERLLDGIATRVYKIKTLFRDMGIESVAYVIEDGTVLEDVTAGGGITMRLEPEDVAKDVNYTNDTIVSNAAKVDKPVRNARNRTVLSLRIQGPLADDHLFNDGRQHFEKAGDSFTFVGRKISASSLNTAPLFSNSPEAAEWLKPSLFVQSDNPKIIEQAKKIVGDETDAFRASSLLSEWVSANVRSTFSAQMSNSLDVLDSMEGDCTEHSILYIGLARAAGIPAREVAGLIYTGYPEPGFYFHQWATAWVGEWIDVDPTFNQPIADATHIKLVEGDLFEQTRLLPVIGQLHIQVND
jgi:hypothetical protein